MRSPPCRIILGVEGPWRSEYRASNVGVRRNEVLNSGGRGCGRDRRGLTRGSRGNTRSPTLGRGGPSPSAPERLSAGTIRRGQPASDLAPFIENLCEPVMRDTLAPGVGSRSMSVRIVGCVFGDRTLDTVGATSRAATGRQVTGAAARVGAAAACRGRESARYPSGLPRETGPIELDVRPQRRERLRLTWRNWSMSSQLGPVPSTTVS